METLLERMNILREITNILDPRRASQNNIFGMMSNSGGNTDNMSYESLIALGNRIGNVKKGLSKTQIDVNTL